MHNTNRFTEFRSEDVQDLLSQQPAWFLRWSTLILLLILLSALYGSWVIRFPDILTAPFALTSVNAPSTYSAASSGKVTKLLAKDGQYVTIGSNLAFLESTAQHEQVLQLAHELRRGWNLISTEQFEQVSNLKLTSFHNLGELQPSYQEFIQRFIQYQSYSNHGFYIKEKSILQQQLNDLKALGRNMGLQLAIHKRDLQLAEEEYRIQQQLAYQKVIAPIELKHEESKITIRKLPYQQTAANIITNTISQRSKQKELLELDKTMSEQKENFLQALNSLQSAVAIWKKKYIICSLSTGYVYLPRRLQKNQQVQMGQELFYIVPVNTAYLGEITITQQNAGAVMIGQTVLVRFASYPYQEYGVVKGTIKSIAQIPIKNGSFIASVSLPTGLTSSYGQRLTYKMGMTGTADIITKDKRLMHRLFYQFRLLFQKRA